MSIGKQKVDEIFKLEKYEYFQSRKQERIDYFKTFGIDIFELLEKVENAPFDKFKEVNYAFGKLESILRICSFLRESNVQENHDTDKAIVANLVCCAEAIYRLSNPLQEINKHLVTGFFKVVESQLKDKIYSESDLETEKGSTKKVFNSIETLYYMRNDYIHNGNFLGVFFLNEQTKQEMSYCMNISSFHWTHKEKKTIFISAISFCNLTYEDFLTIFLEAFKLNIESYLE